MRILTSPRFVSVIAVGLLAIAATTGASVCGSPTPPLGANDSPTSAASATGTPESPAANGAAAPTRPTLTLQTADPGILLNIERVRLGIPSGSEAASISTTRDGAAKAAISAYGPETTVREVDLAFVDDASVVPEIHKLCWVVSIVPPGGLFYPGSGPTGQRTKADFMIALIDASDGRFVEAILG